MQTKRKIEAGSRYESSENEAESKDRESKRHEWGKAGEMNLVRR